MWSRTEPADEIVKAVLLSIKLIRPLLISIIFFTSLSDHGLLFDELNGACRIHFRFQAISPGAHHLNNPTEIRV
jgi:hypothetical protein